MLRRAIASGKSRSLERMCCLAKLATFPTTWRDHRGQLLLTGVRSEFVELVDEANAAEEEQEEEARDRRRLELHTLGTLNEAPQRRRGAAEEPCKYLDVRLCWRARTHLLAWLETFDHYLFHSNKMLEPVRRQVRPDATAAGRDQDASQENANNGDGAASINESRASNQDARLARTEGGSPLLVAANLIIFIAHLIAFISNLDYELLGELSRSQARSPLILENFQSRVLHFNNQVDHRHSGQQSANPGRRHLELPFMMMINMPRASTLTRQDEPCPPPSNGEQNQHLTATSWPAPSKHCSKLSSLSSLSSAAPAIQNQGSQNGQEQQQQQQQQKQQQKHNRKRTTRMHMHYYLLIVTLMDLLSAIHWHGRWRSRHSRRVAETRTRPLLRSRGRAAPAMAAAAARSLGRWLQTCALLLASPKYLFQLMQVLLVSLMIPGEFSDLSLGRPPPSLRRLTSLMSSMNLLNQIVAYALRAYEASGCQFTTSQLEQGGAILTRSSLQNRQSNRLNQSEHRRNIGDQCKLATCNSELEVLKKLKCYLNISRMCHLKLTLMTIFLHLDAIQKPFELTPESVILSACVIQTFFAMYERYNEYHTNYSLNALPYGSATGDTHDASKLEIFSSFRH